jgi:hypothetical protein
MAERTLAHLLDRELQRDGSKYCALYEDQLKRFWPPSVEDPERKIAQFAKKYGFRVRFYSKGLCVIFDKEPAIRHEVHRS